MLVCDFKGLEPLLNGWSIEDLTKSYLMSCMIRIEHFSVSVCLRAWALIFLFEPCRVERPMGTGALGLVPGHCPLGLFLFFIEFIGGDIS